MSEFDHPLPNTDLTNIKTVADVVVVFSTPVRDSTKYEDLTKLDLPPNLHVQLEPLRFDPETDTMFGGVTAFPGRKTVVSSLKFRRKYGKKQ
jgi:large subunit ribosomal protein L50